MKTTDLYVELIVLGVEVSLCILFLSLPHIDYYTVYDELSKNINIIKEIATVLTWVLTFFALTIIYILGLLYDRLCDAIFDKFESKSRDNFKYYKYDESDNYLLKGKSRAYIYASNDRVDLYRWYRSRIRILRSVCVTFILITFGTVYNYKWYMCYTSLFALCVIGPLILAFITFSLYNKCLYIYNRTAYIIERESKNKKTE